MPEPGRPPVPLERKRKLGHLREDRIPGGKLVEIQRPGGELEAPKSLGPEGLAFWERVTGAAHWLWPKIDQTLLEITAEAVEERAILRAYVLENPDDWRSRASLRHLEKQLLGHLAALGFTPSDRARLGLIEAKTGGKLEELMRMRDEIRAGTWERKSD